MTDHLQTPGRPDEAARRRITDDLDRTFLVEAGAGSGKTKSLVDRMIATIATGRATIQTQAAVTFTRKAAADLRGRFQVALERSLRDVSVEGGSTWGPEEKARLKAALDDLEQGFIGTIHSFCAGLLRQRPVESGVDPEFEEMEEIDDAVFRETCWHDFLADARQACGPLLDGLDEAGLSPSDLRDAFDVLATYPEVEAQPGRNEPPDPAGPRAALESFLKRAEAVMPVNCPDGGWDPLQFLMRRLFNRRDRLGFGDPALLMDTLELLEGNPDHTQKRWRSKEEVLRFVEDFESFKAGTVAPTLQAWREFRHEKALAYLKRALAFYEDRRRARSRLNFGDQLLLARALLKGNPGVRRYFQSRIQRLLVDEFQDTDPIQAEILFYLTGTDTRETDWTKLRPAPGALFLVGDPKQSIYRFRRADIDTYNLAKEVIVRGGGEVLELVANFRSLSCIGDYVNSVFSPGGGGPGVFPARATETQAGYAPLVTGRASCAGSSRGVFKIVGPKEPRHSEKPIARNDAAVISEFIARATEGGLRVQERGHDGREEPRPARPEDFLILFRYKKNMDIYARSLEARGIPYEISGSDAFSDSPDVAAIVVLLQALQEPTDPVHAVAALRSVFFGLSDQQLLDHRMAGGTFDPTDDAALAGSPPGPALTALRLLREWRVWTQTAPPSVALEMILEASGLLGHLVSSDMGSSRAGDVLKLVEIVRSLEARGTTSFADVIDFIGEPGRLESVEEMSLTPGRRDAVRLMNLHKAKGLEAPVVFLANPAGMKDREPDKHIERMQAVPGRGPRPAEGSPRGYFLFKKRVGFNSKRLSQPVGWAEVLDRAIAYRDAEEDRLMYVAATRARDMLVISSYQGDLGAKKAWRTLDAGLESVQSLEPPPGRQAPGKVRAGRSLSRAEVMAAGKRLQERKGVVSRARYRLESVTSLASTGPRTVVWSPAGHGREWGTAVHSLLSALGRVWPLQAQDPNGAVLDPERVLQMARNALAAAGLGREAAGELAALVTSIVRSNFWRRAMAASLRQFETPF
jgi:ATP-dependent helicase/nuclease subunit A